MRVRRPQSKRSQIKRYNLAEQKAKADAVVAPLNVPATTQAPTEGDAK